MITSQFISQFQHPAFLLGADFTILGINEAAREWLSLGDDLKIHWDKGLGPYLKPLLIECMAQKCASEDVFPGELEGRIHPRLLSLQYMKVDGNDAVMVQSFELKENSLIRLGQESLVTAERVSLALRSRRVGFFDWNVKTGVLIWDRTQWEVFGYSSKDFETPMHAFNVAVTGDGRERVWREIEDALKGTRPYNNEFQVVTSTGEVRTVRGTGICFWDDDGQASRLIGLNWDVTHRRKLQAQFDERARITQKIFEMLPAFITIGDIPNDRMKFANRRYSETFGVTTQEALERPFSDWRTFLAPDQMGKFQDYILQIRALADSEVADMVVKIVDQHNHERWLRLQTQVFERNPTGAMSEIITVGVDITEEIRLAAAAENDRAKAFNSSKHAALGQMAGGIAHEVNNPLTIIIAKVEQLRKSVAPGDTKSQEDIDRIVQMCQRIAKIIRSMRTVSRIEESESFQRTSLQQVIDDVLILCNQRMNNMKIKLEVAPVPATLVDLRPVQISQILLNLLNNAVDAVAELDEKWIRIDFSERGKNFLITVTDSGRGIEADVAARMTEPFFTTKPVGKGTGLGLSISLSLAELHAGTLVYDAKSKNTTFVLSLPKTQTLTT